MKKRLFALLMAMVMLLGMGVVSHAQTDGVKVYEGTGEFDFSMYNIPEIKNGNFVASYVRWEEGEAYKRLIFKNNQETHSLFFEDIDGVCYLTDYNGYDYTYLGEAWHNFYLDNPDDDGNINFSSKISFGTESSWFYINYDVVLQLLEEPTIHEISAPFTGTAVSDREEYTLALAGYFEKELTDGTHELSLDEIKEQTISIVAYNKANGVKRVMTQSTIEEMSVTVSGGEVTQYVIRGRVQTNGGKLDRYTAVIEK